MYFPPLIHIDGKRPFCQRKLFLFKKKSAKSLKATKPGLLHHAFSAFESQPEIPWSCSGRWGRIFLPCSERFFFQKLFSFWGEEKKKCSQFSLMTHMHHNYIFNESNLTRGNRNIWLVTTIWSLDVWILSYCATDFGPWVPSINSKIMERFLDFSSYIQIMS